MGTADHIEWSSELSLGLEYRSEQPYHLQQLLARPRVLLGDGVPKFFDGGLAGEVLLGRFKRKTRAQCR